MTEYMQVITAIEEALQAGRAAALATVINVKGSAYRREGAKMAIDEEGQTTGMISGGCLEPDVAALAEDVLKQGRAVHKQYALDEDAVWGLGLGCPGTVDLYVESVQAEAMETSSPLGAFLYSVKKGKAGVLGTLMNPKAQGETQRLFIPEEGMAVGSFGSYALDEWFGKVAQDKLGEQSPKSEMKEVSFTGGETFNVFIDVHVPPIELMIFGAGHDAIPLAQMGAALGWTVTVVDPRPAYNDAERFPAANRILIHPQAFENRIHIGHRTYVVVMNHHIERDQDTLAFVLESKAPYVGVLGPRSRRIRMLEAIEAGGTVFSSAAMERMYSPIGLDIGAVSSEEIAVSIVSEILSVRNGHGAGFLQGKEAIHQPSAHACRSER
ncbi:XdhC family protein [Aneurinibacillus sp. REN35]|uniref:XdhC family protein n=1 Tax=Aneurinibacillus sp. REN35 TaxID=3237286 RepID=UPI003528D832